MQINGDTTADTWTGEGKEHAFRIQTGTDELILCATSAEDCKAWIEAVRKVANPPPPPSTGNAELDRANAEAHTKALEVQRTADEAERLAREGAGLMALGNVSLEGALHSAGGALMGAAGEEAERLARAEAERLLQQKAEEEAAAKAAAEKEAAEAKAAAAKRALLSKIQMPVACEKKLSTENAYHPRFVWVNTTTKEFHWGKTNDPSKSKCISCPGNVKSIAPDSEVGGSNFTIQLKDAESVSWGGVFSGTPTAIQVKLDDAEINSAFISCISDLMA